VSTYTIFALTIAERVQDAAGKLSPVATQMALHAALEEYSRDCPREVAVSVPGTGAFDYAVSGFGAAESGATASTQWAAGFSAIAALAYPYSVTDRYLAHLEPDEYSVVRLPAGEVLRFTSASPSAAEAFLVTYTRPHEVTQTIGTVPVSAEQAVCSLAAAIALASLASFYAQATDSTFNADVADHRGRTSVYLDLAREYRRHYYAHVGRASNGETPRQVATGANVDLDRGYLGGRVPHLFHGRRIT
jgi:hypothetical protein